MEREQEIEFANQLRTARESALKDAEAFDGILHAIERLGQFLRRQPRGDLRKYEYFLTPIAERSVLASPPSDFREIMAPFSVVYDMVRNGRNDALHQGAFARHLTNHAVELSIILEDALMNGTSHERRVSDYMIKNPVCAEMWHPIGHIRQQMLAGSYSFLPVWDLASEEWMLISDEAIAKFLGSEKSVRDQNLITPLMDAKNILVTADSMLSDEEVAKGIEKLKGKPLLVMRRGRPKELLGIVTAFDLM